MLSNHDDDDGGGGNDDVDDEIDFEFIKDDNDDNDYDDDDDVDDDDDNFFFFFVNPLSAPQKDSLCKCIFILYLRFLCNKIEIIYSVHLKMQRFFFQNLFIMSYFQIRILQHVSLISVLTIFS